MLMPMIWRCCIYPGIGGNLKPRHGYSLGVSQDLEAETQPCYDGDDGLSFTQSRPNVSLKSTLMVNSCRSVPTYIGVKLDRSLTFRHHLETLGKKLANRVMFLRRFAGSRWGAGAETLRTASLFLVYFTAEDCSPVWCLSAHTRLIDSVLNDASHIITGCLRPTPTDHLSILSGIFRNAPMPRKGSGNNNSNITEL